jgi:hypothetical protein
MLNPEIVNFLEEMNKHSESSKLSLWPIAIFETRYGGTYEFGAKWFAFPFDEQQAPEEALGEDVECSNWFVDNKDRIGLGETPNDALSDLFKKRLG